MAQVTVGEALHIPPEVIDRLNAAQTAINTLADNTKMFINKVGPDFVAMMGTMSMSARQMANSVSSDFQYTIPTAIETMLKKMSTAQTGLGTFGSDIGKSLAGNVQAGLTGAIPELVGLLSRLGGAQAAAAQGGEKLGTVLNVDMTQVERLREALNGLALNLTYTNERISALLNHRSGGTGSGTAEAVALIETSSRKAQGELKVLIELEREALSTSQSALAKERSLLASLEEELARTKRLKEGMLASGRGEGNKYVKEYTADIERLKREITATQQRIGTLTAETDTATARLERMTGAMGRKYDVAGIEDFKRQLRSMSQRDIESVISQLERMRMGLPKTAEGKLSGEFMAVTQYINAANKELERTKALVEGTRRATYDWEGNLGKMTATGLGASTMKNVEEMRALHAALKREIMSTGDRTSESNQKAISAYHAVTKAVKDYEAEVKGAARATKEIKPPVGIAERLAAILASAQGANASITSLEVAWRSLMGEMRSMSLDKVWTPDWYRGLESVRAAVVTFESWKSRIDVTNKALQDSVDKMAWLHRDTQQSGSAAMGRWTGQGDYTRAYDEISRSIHNVTTTSERLKRDLSDVQEILSKTAKYDSTGKIREEWQLLCDLEEKAKNRLNEYKREASKPVKSNYTASDAMALAKTAGTYEQLKTAITALKQAMNGLNPKTQAGEWNALNRQLQQTEKEFDTLRRKMGEVKEQTQSIGGKLRELRQLAIGAFTIQSVYGYVKQMVEVHAQLRLQNVALRAIIQNKAEADRIFMQVQQMALRSPFSVMQLTTYTKQLAAYRVEADKLVGTTKMLADVSAGLGVDIQRLILAYGQVKSANYLRATEVRQFTEAGLNIAGELSKLFTETEGHMVTVADVMDMISKRMVKFEDVEEVFRRITSAGGLFYDMQKKQSDTVHGQMQRIADAYTLMMDEIGQSNSGPIQTALTSIRGLIANWRVWAAMLKDAVVVFGLYKAATLYAALANSKFAASMMGGWSKLTSMTFSIKQLPTMLKTLATNSNLASVAMKGLGAAANMALGGVALYALSQIVEKFYEWRTGADEAREAVERIKGEAMADSDNAVARYKTLAEKVRSVATSEKERADALDELNRTYGEFLPKQLLEAEGIRAITDGYAEATQAIRTHYAEVEKHNLEEHYRGEYQKQLQKLLGQSGAALTGGPIGVLMSGYGLDETEISAKLSEAIRTGFERGYNEAKDYQDLFLELLGEYTGDETIRQTWEKNQDLRGALEDLIGPYTALMNVEERMSDIVNARTKAEVAEADELRGKWKERKDTVAAIGEAYRQLIKDEKNAEDAGGVFDATAALEKLQELYDKLGIAAPDIRKIAKDARTAGVKITEELERAGVEASEALIRELGGGMRDLKSLIDEWGPDIKGAILSMFPNMSGYMQGVMGQIMGEMSGNIAGVAVDNIRTILGEVRLKYHVGDIFGVDESASGTVQGALTAVKGKVDNLNDALEKYNNAVAAGTTEEMAASLHLAGKSAETVQNEVNAATEAYHRLGGAEKKTVGGSREGQKDIWSRRLQVMRQVQQEYEKLLKYYDAETAKAKLLENYSYPVRVAFFETPWQKLEDWKGLDKRGMANTVGDMFNAVRGQITEKDGQKLLEFIGKLRSEMNLKEQEESLERLKKDVDELISRYELTKTFAEMGVSTDLMSEMFGELPIKDMGKLRDMVKSVADEGKKLNLGEDFTKWVGEVEKRLTGIEDKEWQERSKNMIKYTKEAMSERGKIVMEALQEQNRVMQSQDMDEQTKALAVDNIGRRMAKDLAARDWEDFKGTEMYVRMFEDMEGATTRSIERMKSKIEELQQAWGSKSPGQVRAMVKELETLEAQLRTRDPFGQLKKSMEAVQKLQSQGKTRELLETELEGYAQKDMYLKAAIDELEQAQALRVTEAQGGVVTAEMEKARAKYAGLTNAELSERLKGLRAEQETNQQNVNNTSKQLKLYEEQVEAVKSAQEAWGQYMDAARKAYDIVKETLETMGVDMDDVKGIVAEGVLKLIDMAGQLVLNTLLIKAMGVQMKSAMGVIGYILIALEAIATVITTIVRAGDAKKQKKIERLKDNVDALAKSYETLKEKVEEAYKLIDVESKNSLAGNALRREISAYEQMLQLEQSKKKSDSSAVKEYKDKIRELRKELEELENEQTKRLGGFGTDGRLDAAQTFVDAWLDAFKETGDGLDALGQQWDDYIEGLLKKQAAYRIAGKRMEAFFDEIDRMASAHTEMSMREILERIQDGKSDILERANEELREFFEYFGWGSNGELLLSDLQKGIQNITEEQAAALESITNSIRFGVWRQVDLLGEILAAVRGQYTGGGDAQVSELKGIRAEVAETRRLLASVIRRGVGDGRAYVKVN